MYMETFFATNSLLSVAIIIILISWTLIWKGLAMWRAAHMEHRYWFVVLLVLNTVGILDIIYLYVVAPKKKEVAEETLTQV